MQEKTKYVDLKLDKSLLDWKFDGYKLCLDSFPIKERTFSNGFVSEVKASDCQWSYQHVLLFSSHNHIHHDIWSTNEKSETVFIILNGSTLSGVNYNYETKTWSTPEQVAKLDLPADFSNRGDRYNLSISFPDHSLALIGDCCGKLYLYQTGLRSALSTWQELFWCIPIPGDIDGRAFVIQDSVINSDQIDCLLQTVEEQPKETRTSTGDSVFVTWIYWITLQKIENSWQLTRTRSLKTRGNVDYVSLMRPVPFSICTVSSRPVVFVEDSEKPVKEEVPQPDNYKKIYTWGQSKEDCCAVFRVGPEVTKNDIDWRLASDSIKFTIGDRILLDGELGGDVDVDASTWTIVDQRIEITLTKRTVGQMWCDFVKGDARGEYCPDPDLVREMSEKLRAFTSESDKIDDSYQPPYDPNQLEDCDSVSSDSFVYFHNGDTHTLTHQADISGHQFLFTKQISNDKMPALCLRHDVDGILWSIDNQSLLRHENTFNAFGYVQASKQQRKYCTCASDCAYTVVIEHCRHAFIYWQPSSVESELKNRKTGQKVPQIAKQHLVTLDSSDHILGVCALPSMLILLTNGRLYGILLKE